MIFNMELASEQLARYGKLTTFYVALPVSLDLENEAAILNTGVNEQVSTAVGDQVMLVGVSFTSLL